MPKQTWRKGQPKLFKDRFCPYCGDVIPRVSRYGRRLKASQYKKKKTCGYTSCWGESQVATREINRMELTGESK